MVHGNDRIVDPRGVSCEKGIGGKRARQGQSPGAEGAQNRVDDPPFLRPQITSFAGMRVQSQHGDPGLHDSPVSPQGLFDERDPFAEKGPCQLARDGIQRSVNRRQPHTEPGRNEHHGDMPGTRKSLEQLRLARGPDPRQVERSLRDWRSDDSRGGT